MEIRLACAGIRAVASATQFYRGQIVSPLKRRPIWQAGGMVVLPNELAALLKPEFDPQQAFSYPLERWHRWIGHLDGLGSMLDSLPGALDRRTAAPLIEDLVPDDPAGAFVVAMIWGHGKSGYGPYRTAWILTGSRTPSGLPLDSTVLQRLKESVEIARDQGAVEGYRYLNWGPGKISGLGPSFFTKWLYFITARGDEGAKSAAPVLDALVLQWLKQQANLTLRAGSTRDYSLYIETLSDWGAGAGLSPAQVEERIFRIIRGDGAAQAEGASARS